MSTKFWEHNCPVDGPTGTAKGEACNSCGAVECRYPDCDYPCMDLPDCKDAEQAQPVAWANPNDLQSFDMKVRTNGGPLHTVPLYTAPPPRQPLTDEEIDSMWREATLKPALTSEFVRGFARAIEAAHGIKGEA